MSMSLLPAYYTTSNLRKRKAKKPSKSAREHEAWLKSMGLHISQLPKKRKSANNIKEYDDDKINIFHINYNLGLFTTLQEKNIFDNIR